MNTVNPIEIGEKPHPTPEFNAPKMKISDIKQMMMMWPAIMFANNLMMSANGLVKMPRISTGIIINFTPNGTGGQKI